MKLENLKVESFEEKEITKSGETKESYKVVLKGEEIRVTISSDYDLSKELTLDSEVTIQITSPQKKLR